MKIKMICRDKWVLRVAVCLVGEKDDHSFVLRLTPEEAEQFESGKQYEVTIEPGSDEPRVVKRKLGIGGGS